MSFKYYLQIQGVTFPAISHKIIGVFPVFVFKISVNIYFWVLLLIYIFIYTFLKNRNFWRFKVEYNPEIIHNICKIIVANIRFHFKSFFVLSLEKKIYKSDSKGKKTVSCFYFLKNMFTYPSQIVRHQKAEFRKSK